MNYVEAVIAMVVTIIAISAVFFTIEEQKTLYNKILISEISKLQAENLLWQNPSFISTPVYLIQNNEKVEKNINVVKFNIDDVEVTVYFLENVDF
ncbi:hypothetical protein SU69_03815 [Thermosipho melanesiensis]|uniref:Uncharacterized protein n=2 Tax=Thermosipho melanesiensis TaxID=46541 RepID=A6LL05_THEM4|nr:hypothetical protein [Thermosipho melanesiensis]ABR30606.1 hypothetical protein Tmel_0743 [Thermosipho melanesiensis BI429]APT74847.1 hypothetical protein BW47_04015 [Thermosipho melanesiensis]OOC35687.1 hypothetical protein SU68_03870 [Thermosipho melanesiensis]OOC38986.1 hypothetical protein SU69_03815 [Thermosipho melanesiensis]OOC39134.1 hypothetical protein SU70_03815 [Thermosipho melanesiensis]